MGRLKIKNKKTVPYNLKAFDTKQIADTVGVRVESLNVWAAERQREMREEAQREASLAASKVYTELLTRSENYAGFYNLICSLYAIRSAWHIKKAMARFLDEYEHAQEYVEQVGFQKAYEDICKECEINLGFEDFEIEDIMQEIIERGQIREAN